MEPDTSPVLAREKDEDYENVLYSSDYVRSRGSIFFVDTSDAGSGFEPELDSDFGPEDSARPEVSFDSLLDGAYYESLPPDDIRHSRRAEVNPGGTGTLYTTFLIVNAALGGALLNFPKAFDEAGGIWVVVFLQGLLLLFILVALFILAVYADKFKAQTLQETMYGSAGNFGKYLTSGIVALYCFGTTVTFLIIIGDQFDRVLGSWVGPKFYETWYFDRMFTISASSVLCILPLCFSEKIDFLKLPSAIGVLAILYIVWLIIFEYYFGNFIPGKIKTQPDSWTDVFLVVPVICFGYQCHVSVIPIYSCMKRRRVRNFSVSAFTAIAICCFCYTGAAGWGYYTFGSYINPDILLSYDATDPKVLLANVAMALKTVTTYPILLYCGREALITAFFAEGERQRIHTILVVSAWFLLSLLSALFIPNIDLVIKALGSLAAIFIFVFPGMCLFQSAVESDPSFTKRTTVYTVIISIIFHVIGFFIFGVVLTQAFRTSRYDGVTGSLRYENRIYF